MLHANCETCRRKAAEARKARFADIINAVACFIALAAITGFCLLVGGQ